MESGLRSEKKEDCGCINKKYAKISTGGRMWIPMKDVEDSIRKWKQKRPQGRGGESGLRSGGMIEKKAVDGYKKGG